MTQPNVMPAPPVSGFHAVFVFLALAPPFSVLRSQWESFGAGVGDENLEGVHAVTMTTDFLRLLSYISGLVRSASVCVTARAMTMTRPRSISPYRRAHTSINGYNCACLCACVVGKGREQDCHT